MATPFLLSSSSITAKKAGGPCYRRLHHGVYVGSDAPDDLRVRVAAALLVQPTAVVCGTTAAVLLRLPVDDDGVVHLTRDQWSPRSRRSAVKVHRLDVAADEVLELRGVRVTTPLRTLADLANGSTLLDLVAVADVVAAREGLPALRGSLDRAWGRPGVQRLREAAGLADPGAGSPAESRARVRVHAAGFTALRHGVVIRDRAGEWLAAPDLADPVARVAVQHDGAVHFEKGLRQRVHDLARDELSRAEGWEVVISTSVDDDDPAQLVRKVEAAYRRSAQRLGPHVLPEVLRAA